MIPFRYEIYGLPVASQFDLRLPQCERSAPEVTIVHGPSLSEVPQASSIASDGNALIVSIAGSARFRIAAGKTIAVSAAPTTDPAELRLFLLGSVFGLLLQQRGTLALHANATSNGHRAIAIAGPSGAGKSTLAAHLCLAGMTLLSDDVCALSFDAPSPLVLPGLPRLRLWADARARIGWSDAAGRPVSHRIDKLEFDAAAPASQPVPLGAIYVLDRCEPGKLPSFVRVAGADAVQALMLNTYRGDFLDLTGARQVHFGHCVGLARTVPIVRWRRRWAGENVAEDAAQLIEHAHSLWRMAEAPQ